MKLIMRLKTLVSGFCFSSCSVAQTATASSTRDFHQTDHRGCSDGNATSFSLPVWQFSEKVPL